jgi:hypothetical protein
MGRQVSASGSSRTGATLSAIAKAWFPTIGVLGYSIATFSNLCSYLFTTAVRAAGENYETYMSRQLWLNPLVRIPDHLLAFPSRVLEATVLQKVMAASSDKAIAYFIYTIAEIAAIDLLAGSILWYVLLTLSCRRLFLTAQVARQE